jgi:hypothetical protein
MRQSLEKMYKPDSLILPGHIFSSKSLSGGVCGLSRTTCKEEDSEQWLPGLCILLDMPRVKSAASE